MLNHRTRIRSSTLPPPPRGRVEGLSPPQAAAVNAPSSQVTRAERNAHIADEEECGHPTSSCRN
eukprot:365603-Chlamydomonas_euryale.AAC.12